MVIGQAEGKYLKSCFLLLLRFVVMLFCCENQFSFTKKSVCTWLTEQPLSQWMMAIIIKREDFSKQEWFACKRQEQRREREKQEKNWFPSLFFSFHSATQYSLGANMGLSFFHHDTSMLYYYYHAWDSRTLRGKMNNSDVWWLLLVQKSSMFSYINAN